MDSSSAICEFTYDNMFEHIEKMIRLELLINNPSEEAKSLVKLMSKLVRSELVMDIVKTASNPVSAANLLQIGCGDMSECYDENVIDKLVNFFNESDEAAQLGQELIRSNEEIDKITSACEKELSEYSDQTVENVTFQSRYTITEAEDREKQNNSCFADSSF